MSSNTTYNELHENAKNLELEQSRQVPLTSAYLVTPVPISHVDSQPSYTQSSQSSYHTQTQPIQQYYDPNSGGAPTGKWRNSLCDCASAFIFSIVLRFHIIRKYQINESNSIFEFLIGFFCFPCSIAQMAKHVYGWNKLLDGDSNPDMPDQYTAHQV